MLNRTADHALRAVMFVAQRGEQRACSSSEIAKALGLPRNYLGKVLYALTGAGVLVSVRGPRGGFRIAQSASAITLADVAAPFQRPVARRICLQANRPCDPAHACSSHRMWQAAADQVSAFFRNTTIAHLLEDPGTAAPHSLTGDRA